MTNPAEERRSRKVVDKDLQTRIIMQVSWPMGLVMVITAVVLVMFGIHLRAETTRLGVELTGLMPLIGSTAILFAFAVVSQVLIALIVSHRIAGSAYRIRQTLNSFREGDPKCRAHLRAGDLHTRLAADVNEFLDWVETSKSSPTPAPAPAREREKAPGPAPEEKSAPV